VKLTIWKVMDRYIVVMDGKSVVTSGTKTVFSFGEAVKVRDECRVGWGDVTFEVYEITKVVT